MIVEARDRRIDILSGAKYIRKTNLGIVFFPALHPVLPPLSSFMNEVRSLWYLSACDGALLSWRWILPLPLNQEGQLSVTGGSMYTSY